MSNLPLATDTAFTGNLAVTIFQKAIEKKRWLFRRQCGENDFGFDVEIEVVDHNMVTGKLAKVQVKGADGLEWASELESVSVRTSTYNLWTRTRLPVLAVLVDTKAETVTWTIPASHTPKPGAESVSLRFPQENNLDTTFDEMRSFITSWYSAFDTSSVLRDVPHFREAFRTLKEMEDWGDAWTSLPEDTDFDTRMLYRHVLQLRAILGFNNAAVIPIEHWYIRNYALWQENSPLYHGTFSELIKYIAPLYEDAFTELKKRLQALQQQHAEFATQELFNFVLSHDQPADQRVEFLFAPPELNDPSFMVGMEKHLEAMQALKFRAKKVDGSSGPT